MSFNDFVHNYGLEKATSNTRIRQMLSSLSLSDVGTILGDGLFMSDVRIVRVHPSKITHWVTYNNQNYFDSNGCSSKQNYPSSF